jgi:hypothetical protein
MFMLLFYYYIILKILALLHNSAEILNFYRKLWYFALPNQIDFIRNKDTIRYVIYYQMAFGARAGNQAFPDAHFL